MAPRNSEARAPADGDVIRALRLERGLRLKEAAALVRCHPKSLDKIERKVAGASEVMIHRIANAYGVKPDQIRRQEAAA